MLTFLLSGIRKTDFHENFPYAIYIPYQYLASEREVICLKTHKSEKEELLSSSIIGIILSHSFLLHFLFVTSKENQIFWCRASFSSDLKTSWQAAKVRA